MPYRGVALCGRAGSGKSSIAQAIVDLRPDWSRHSFAGALKADLQTLDIYKGDPGFRQIAQAYGTEFARGKYGEDYWIERLRDRIAGDWDGVVIDDMRFQNELDFCKAKGLLCISVYASEELRAERLGCLVPAHASENPPWDVWTTITNNGRKPPEFWAEYLLRVVDRANLEDA